jgi:hypothetical protein
MGQAQMKTDVDLGTLSHDQLVARLQIAQSEHKRLSEANQQLHRMMETLRDNGWAHPRPADMLQVRIRPYPMPDDPRLRQPDTQRQDLAKKLDEANQRADHWRQKYMTLLDQTGRPR